MNTTHIAQTAVGIIQLISDGKHIYTIAANAMDAVEAMQDGSLKGTDKKAWVLAYVKNIVMSLAENWDYWEQLISTFIDKLKTAYNAVKGLFKL